MNRTSRSAIKHKAGGPAMADHAAPVDDFDYEAIEAAVMQTARGRWFLAEYLRRHQNDETRRLATALRKLASAQERLLMPARETAALDGIRLLFARAADELAPAGEERTLPEAAASRLGELLSAASNDAERAMAACDVLAGCFTQLARLLGEPVPQPAFPPRETDAGEESLPPHDDHVRTGADSRQTAGMAGTDEHQSACGPRAVEGNPAHPAPRIVIHRRPRSGEVDIPLPEGEAETTPTTNSEDSSGQSSREGKRSRPSAARGRVRVHIRGRA